MVEANGAHSVGEVEAGEVAPQARVRRSRMAFALSATVAALPVLVLDNLAATAAPDEVRTVAAEGSSSSTEAPTTSSSTEPPTTTTVMVVVAQTVAQETTTSEPARETTTTEADVVVAHTAAGSSSPATEPAPTPAPTTTQAPPPAPSGEGYAYGDPNDPATWDRLARCESGGNWAANTGNGYYGGLQFSLASWQDVGGSGYPHEHSREEQIHRGRILQARYGWGQWPHCSAKLGYR